MNFDDLGQLVRAAERRSHVFEAMRRMIRADPTRAREVLREVLEDPKVSDRPKAIVVYFLDYFHDQFPGFQDIVGQHRGALEPLVQDVASDVDAETEEGRDPFEVEDFPND